MRLNNEQVDLSLSLEAVLFASDRPLSASELSEALRVSELEIREALERLAARLDASSALQVVYIAGGYQLCTRPHYAGIVAAVLRPERRRLSRSMLETLAVVAYRQPVTAAEIDAIRGAQSDYALRQLLEKRLIKEVGRKATPGRPILYGTTQLFLHQFNLTDLRDLPRLAADPREEPRAIEPAPQPRLEGLVEAERRVGKEEAPL